MQNNERVVENKTEWIVEQEDDKMNKNDEGQMGQRKRQKGGEVEKRVTDREKQAGLVEIVGVTMAGNNSRVQ